MLLAEDSETLIKIISYLKTKSKGETEKNNEFIIPLHPQNENIKGMKTRLPYTSFLRTHPAFMIKVLKSDSSINFRENQGVFILPPHFDVA